MKTWKTIVIVVVWAGAVMMPTHDAVAYVLGALIAVIVTMIVAYAPE